MATVTLGFTSGGSSYSRSYTVQSIRGFDEADEYEHFGVQQGALSGSVTETFLGFRRIFTVDLGVVSDATDRVFLLYWMLAASKSITYNSESVYVVLVDPGKFANEWMESTHLGRRYILHLAEQNIRVTWPATLVEGEVAYIKNKVQITGTQASPESFQTNSGKLVTDETGNSYPVFDDTTHVFHVSANAAPYQEAMVNIVTQVSEAAGKLSFSLAVSDYGKPASDGNYYADIVIIAQAKSP